VKKSARLLMCFVFTLGFGLCSTGWSQVNVSPKGGNPQEISLKKTILVDYHSWFENLTFNPTTGTRSGVKAIYYGFSANYDLTQYLTTWGWGTQLGIGQGYAVGDGDTNSYLQKRVSWNYLRGGGRIFKRLNGRTDLGLNLLIMYNKISWPQSDGTVSPGPNPFFSLFIEARWRMTRQWEMIQALGNSTNDAGANLRFGFGYTL
jgi:hypothetical protein